MSGSPVFRAVAHRFRTLSMVVVDLVRLASLAARSHSALAAENLFLRKQLAPFQERKIKGWHRDSRGGTLRTHGTPNAEGVYAGELSEDPEQSAYCTSAERAAGPRMMREGLR
jgi:hypothetical protein